MTWKLRSSSPISHSLSHPCELKAKSLGRYASPNKSSAESGSSGSSRTALFRSQHFPLICPGDGATVGPVGAGGGVEERRWRGLPWWQEHDVFVKTLGMLELDTLMLSLSLKQTHVEMQGPTLADVFIFSSVLCLTWRQTQSITLPATLVFFSRCSTLWSPCVCRVCQCMFVLGKSKGKKGEEETQRGTGLENALQMCAAM